MIHNEANTDIESNCLQCEEVDIHTNKIIYACKWITSLPITNTMIKEFVQTARSRWKIENETFNVLKNQDYILDHNS